MRKGRGAAASGVLWTLSTSLSLLEAPWAKLGIPTSWASPRRSQTPQAQARGTPVDLPKSRAAGDVQREREQGGPEPGAGSSRLSRSKRAPTGAARRGVRVLACSCCKAFTKAFFSRLVCSAFSAFF